MGRKGVSKRKPKKNNSKSNNNNDSSNTHPGESPSVQSLVKNTRAIIKSGGTNPAGSNKEYKKGK